MRRRAAGLFASFAAAAAFFGGIALSATPAFATGATLTVTPSDDLDNGTYVQIHLTGATAQNGQQVGFAECNETVNASLGNTYGEACKSLGGVPVTNGAAFSGAVVVDGPLQPGAPHEADCTEATNGQCDIVALGFSGGTTTVIASKAITFEAPQTPAVTAQPSDNLTDGDLVTVDATGIPASQSSPVAVEECNTATDESDWFDGGCGPTLFYGAASNHEFSQPVNVQYGLGGCDADASCVIAVLYYDPNTSSNDAVVATTPISFAVPDVQVSVTPTSGLKDGQQLTVSATGVPAEWQAFEIDECNTAYVASHGGLGQNPNQPGCLTVGFHGTFAAGAMTTKVHVTDGALSGGASGPVCDHATNGDCAIVLLDGQHNVVTFANAQPISFRPPVTGPGTLHVTPAAGLYYGAPITVSTQPDLKDGLQAVDVEECNVASVKASGYSNKTCVHLPGLIVKDNAVSGQLPVLEGDFFTNIQYTRWFTCDDKHACEIGLFANGDLASSLVPITFRDPDRGKPVIDASTMSGLKKHESITVKATRLSDLARKIEFSICNVKAMPGKYVDGVNCRQITPPGSVAVVSKNTAVEKVKAFSGVVGQTNRGKKIYCTADTNGSCAIVAVSYESGRGTTFVGVSKKISYKK